MESTKMFLSFVLVTLILSTSTEEGRTRKKPKHKMKMKSNTCDLHPTAVCETHNDCPNTYRCNKKTRECCREKNFPKCCNPEIDIFTGEPYECKGDKPPCRDGYICITHPKDYYSVCCEDFVCYDHSGNMHRKYEGKWLETDGCTECTCDQNNLPMCNSSSCKNQCGEFSEFSPCPMSSGVKTCGKRIQIRKCQQLNGDIESHQNSEIKIEICHPKLPAQCPQPGISIRERVGMLVLGVEVNPRFKYRWMIYFSYGGKVLCGGTIISPLHILTAAHCFLNAKREKVKMGFIVKYIRVKTGKHNITITEPPLEQTKTIKNVTMHESFNSSNNDIAVVTLNSPIQFNNHTHPINLPTEPYEDTVKRLRKGLCRVIGWGATNASHLDQRSEVLMQADINLQKNCTLKSQSDRDRVTDNMFCASAKNPNKIHGPVRLDSCFGDSGGPLMCKEGDKWYQYGIVSWGPSSCGEQSGVYTKISNYLDWIKDVIATPGGWGEFSAYLPCTVSCGGGTMSRVRVCTNPAPIGNGECPGYSFKTTSGVFVQTEDVECNTMPCILPIETTCNSSSCENQCGEFSEFSPCPMSSGVKTCGKQIQIRKCQQLNGDLESQRNSEIKTERCHPKLPAQCPQPGITIRERVGMLVLGVEVNPKFKYGWMVYFSYRGKVVCGGTIISPLHILTAAHCFLNAKREMLKMDFIVRYLRVKTGKHNITITEPPLEQIKIIKNVSMHESFNSSNNDIAIVTLSSPIQFNNHTHPINLPTEPFADTVQRLRRSLCRVIGWGATNASQLDQRSEVLMQADINLQRNCTLKSQSDRDKVTDNMFCASAKNPNKTHGPVRLDSCFGDSGGPFMCKEGNKWYQYGIVSWGPSSCGEQSGVYTKISNYLDWIKGAISTPGGWGEFSGYSPCSVECGGGTMSRVRVCTNPEPIGNGDCPGYSFKTTSGDFVHVEDVDCNTIPCTWPLATFWT